jgi:carboxyl-terminal processing protease
MLKIKLFFFAAILSVSVISSCKKEVSAPTDAPSKIGSREDLTKDSIYLYAKETYLWSDVLPDYKTFMPRSTANVDSTVSKLTQYKLNPKYNLNDPYNRNKYLDKYSFIDEGGIATQLGGTGGDFGFSIFYNSENDLRIKYVYESSPAALKGLKRGYQITKLNGRTDLSYNNQSNVNFVVDAILSGSSSTVMMTVKALDGTTQDITLTKGSYTINPVLYKNVYTAGSKKVGYLVFNSFTTNASAKLDEAFQYFATNNVNELVVDLRYNGGGSVATAEDLINYITPAAQNGKVMYTTYYNQLLQSGKPTILQNQKVRYNGQLYSYDDIDYSVSGNVTNFSKKGSLNVSRVYFIVTGSTASASELVINSLKPVVDVKMIGRRTYGKPVGFFGIHIDKYDMYIPQFQTKNQADFGDYFDGFAVDKEDVDDVTKDFGNPAETLLSHALNFSASGVYSFGDGSVTSLSGLDGTKADQLTEQMDRNEFKGMIPAKPKLKHP